MIYIDKDINSIFFLAFFFLLSALTTGAKQILVLISYGQLHIVLRPNHFFEIRIAHGSLAEMAESQAIPDQNCQNKILWESLPNHQQIIWEKYMLYHL